MIEVGIFYQLSRCLAFRKIKHSLLHWITISIPLVFTIFGATAFFLLPIEPKITGNGSLTRHLITFISILPGFFIAALAAVATFNQPSLDKLMPSPAPKLEIKSRGQSESIELTMRMFLSHLFAYLAALSFFTSLICITADLIVPSVSYWINMAGDYGVTLSKFFKAAYVGVLFWLIGNIITTGLFGLYFLAERMHRPNA